MRIAIIIGSTSRGACRATCPALPGCAAFGASREEAIQRMQAAIRGYLASLDASVPGEIELHVLGHPLPNSRCRLPIRD